MLKTILSLLFSCVMVFTAIAQENVVSIRPVTCAVSAHLGHGTVRDTYLTPLAYQGPAWGVQLERWRTMPSYQWTSLQRLDADMLHGELDNGMSNTLAGRLRYRYALMHPWTIGEWRCSLGPYAGAEIGFDYNLKMAAGNNPAQARVCGNVGASAAIARHYTLRQQSCSVMLLAQAPLLGAAFMPEYGASYYETFLLQTSDNNAHFTSLHNQQDLDVRLTTDLPLAIVHKPLNNTLRLGLGYRIETMHINQITTRYSAFEFVVGWVYQYLPYSRRQAQLLKSNVYEAY